MILDIARERVVNQAQEVNGQCERLSRIIDTISGLDGRVTPADKAKPVGAPETLSSAIEMMDEAVHRLAFQISRFHQDESEPAQSATRLR